MKGNPHIRMLIGGLLGGLVGLLGILFLRWMERPFLPIHELSYVMPIAILGAMIGRFGWLRTAIRMNDVDHEP